MGVSPLSDSLSIRSFRGDYEVRFVKDFRPALKELLRDQDFLLVDENVARLYAPRLSGFLGSYKYLLIKPSEDQKSYQGVEPFIDQLIQAGFRKNHRLVAIGGGITQDIAAFIASILYRGVDWLFVPTNLLSQCDSCIGSKTSINFNSFKNQIGGFHPPKVIINDLTFLDTLSHEELRSGMGEMLHYFLLSGRSDFERAARDYDKVFTERSELGPLIRRSLEIKKSMIERDEFDEGPRNIFNYGHSFGHALESYTRYAVPHGIAVSFGMDIANQISVALGYLALEEAREMRSLLSRNWRPTNLEAINIDLYVRLLHKDKKNVGNDIRVILTRGLGDMFLTSLKLDHRIRAVIDDCFKFYHRDAAVCSL